MQETPAALQAFEDYWALGDSRSFANLLKVYRERSDRGEEVPTVREGTIADWSREHGWQERVKARIEEEAERTREQMRRRADKFREAVATGIETDVRRYIAALAQSNGAALAEDAASLERLTKLFFQLVEQPLADRHEHSGPGGGAVQVEHGLDPAGLASALDGLLAGAAGGASGGTDALGEDSTDD
jgi:hypothetical protein